MISCDYPDAKNLATKDNLCSPVRVYTEWDPLEEVIVGIIDDATVPKWDIAMEATIPEHNHSFFKNNATKPFPGALVQKAKEELEHFVRILESEGVIVKRPKRMPLGTEFSTPFWTSPTGLHTAMPRDSLLAIGDTIIESPMAWRSRYFETFAYRDILKDYFKRGAKWISAPKPTLHDELYDDGYDYRRPEFHSVITEFEPVFDAADFIRLGKDIVGQVSQVTNELGVKWLQRHFEDKFNFHVYLFTDPHPMHIDTTIIPLAPGKVMINKEWINAMPPIFKDWEILFPPESTLPKKHPLYMTSKWISINILMLDEKHVIVEENEEPLILALKNWGFHVIKCPFKHFQSFGGSFHCATLDIRRRGEIKSWI